MGADTVYNPGVEQGNFITQNIPVRRQFGFQKFSIPVGWQGRLFRDGVAMRTLPSGVHRWWSLRRYTISIVDARVRLLDAVAKGSVPGPEDSGQATPPAKVVVPMKITLQLANIDTLLNVDRPLELLQAMIGNHVAIEIGRLRFDQYRNWAATLRDELQRYLQLNAQTRTGLQVQEVFIGEPEGQTEADKRQLALYRTATDIKIQASRSQAANQERVASAATTGQAAKILGVDAWLHELIRTSGGLEIIKADMELRKMAIAAGLMSAQASPISYIPQPEAAAQQAAAGPGLLPPGTPGGYQGPVGGTRVTEEYPASAPGSGYAGPITTPTAPSAASYGVPPSQPFTAYTDSRTPFYTPPSTPQNAPTTPLSGAQPNTGVIDPARLDAERVHFPAGQYIINETQAIVEDVNGIPVHGYQFVLTAIQPAATSTPSMGLWVSFDLGPGFPLTPPTVWVKWNSSAHALRYEGDAVHRWTPQGWLADILAEIVAAHAK